MQPVLSREQIRRYDQLAMSELGISGLALMETAGTGAAAIIRQIADGVQAAEKKQILILCGTGNNGGDGFVVARSLPANFAVTVCVIGDAGKIGGDARSNYELLAGAHLGCHSIMRPEDIPRDEIAGATIIVDALFGTGLARRTEGLVAEVINAMNSSRAVKISLDLPSGLDANTGQPLGDTVRADHTVSFGYYKPGLLTPCGREFTGVLHRVALLEDDDSILQKTGKSALLLDDNYLAAALPRRSATLYKHRAGDILIVAGQRLKTGAAKLCAEAALRSGAGLATILSWSDALPALAAWTHEVMLLEISAGNITQTVAHAAAKRSALVVGPGLGLDQDATALVSEVLRTVTQPVVVDADALTILSRLPAAHTSDAANRVLTPHAGELARLIGSSAAEVEADRYAAVRRAAQQYRCTVVLKGAHTLICQADGEIMVSPYVNPALATAGSGDVLAGIIAALCAHLPTPVAAAAAVLWHARAAEVWCARTRAEYGMLASDLVNTLPEARGSAAANTPAHL